MDVAKLKEYKLSHDSLHRAVGRSEYYIANGADWNKETMQIDMFLKVLEGLSDPQVMMELGTSMFPTYSKAFTDIFPNGKSICTEPRLYSYNTAKAILPNSHWFQCYTGDPVHAQEKTPSKEEIEGVEYRSIANLAYNTNTTYIDILHMDIQGSEVSALESLGPMMIYDLIEYYFVGIHGNFDQVFKILSQDWGYNILYASPDQGGYGDGLIVARRP